nr:MAG TPA: hypothetical protein [Caudoviricetes sp.]DAY11487.1 MAG TPA: hypothetical protein [Caudoviricetes sp.]
MSGVLCSYKILSSDSRDGGSICNGSLLSFSTGI